MSLAQQIHDAENAIAVARDALWDALALDLFGAKVGDRDPFIESEFDKILFEDFITDEYDNSIELTGVPSGYELTSEQLSKLWAMGFAKCWLVYGPKSERTNCPHKVYVRES